MTIAALSPLRINPSNIVDGCGRIPDLVLLSSSSPLSSSTASVGAVKATPKFLPVNLNDPHYHESLALIMCIRVSGMF